MELLLDHTFGLNDAQTVWVNTECGKDHNQKNSSKLILWYRIVCTKSFHTSEETNNRLLFISSRQTGVN